MKHPEMWKEKGKANAQRLRKVAEEILAQPAFQQRSANIGVSLRQAGGPPLTVDEIEVFKRKHVSEIP